MSFNDDDYLEPSQGEIIICALRYLGVLPSCLKYVPFEHFEGAVTRLLRHWSELGHAYWAIKHVNLTVRESVASFQISPDTLVLLNVRLWLPSDASNGGRPLIPITQAEYASRSMQEACGTPNSYSFSCTEGGKFSLWPLPNLVCEHARITFAEVVWLGACDQDPPNPFAVRSRWYDALATGLAYEIKKRYPAPPTLPLDWLEKEAIRAYRTATLIEM